MYNNTINHIKEEVNIVNILKKKSMELLAKEAKLMTKFNVNSTCRSITYQPQMPKGADKLKKYD